MEFFCCAIIFPLYVAHYLTAKSAMKRRENAKNIRELFAKPL